MDVCLNVIFSSAIDQLPAMVAIFSRIARTRVKYFVSETLELNVVLKQSVFLRVPRAGLQLIL